MNSAIFGPRPDPPSCNLRGNRYSMFCVGYGIQTREQIFHNQHNTLYNLLALAQLFPVLLTSRFHTVKKYILAENKMKWAGHGLKSVIEFTTRDADFAWYPCYIPLFITFDYLF